MFSIEHLHLFRFGISKTWKECTVIELTSVERHMPPHGNKREGMERKPNKTQLLHDCNNSLAAYERGFSMSGLRSDFSTSQILAS